MGNTLPTQNNLDHEEEQQHNQFKDELDHFKHLNSHNNSPWNKSIVIYGVKSDRLFKSFLHSNHHVSNNKNGIHQFKCQKSIR